MPDTRFIDPSIATWPGEAARLLGGRCDGCAVVTFPAPKGCPACGGGDVSQVELDPVGTVWTYTVQGFPPPAPPYLGPASPDTFRPFAVAYVDLGSVLVEGPVLGDPSSVRIDDPVRVVFPVLGQDQDGNDVVAFAFEPIEEGSHA
ncbi:MAG: OB-fold domain-containing protein [Acidimicrobiales bacterium]|nr:OB-fold domain-containing protein [Acidimicrobiales bacterium]